MSSLNVILFKSKVLKNGEHPIMVRVIKDRKTKYISVGESCDSSLWDFVKNKPLKKHPFFKELGFKIENCLHKARIDLYALEQEKVEFSVGDMKEKIQKKKSNLNFTEYLDEIIGKLISEKRLGYATSHKDLKRVLLKFWNQKNILFHEINSDFLLKLDDYFTKLNYKPNSKGVYFRTLKATYNKAIKEGHIKENINPFKNFTVGKFKNETKKRALQRFQIESIKNLNLNGDSHYYDAYNFFLFSYYCAGINFIDYCKLTHGNFFEIGNTMHISYQRSKTKKNFAFILHPKAVEIFSKYKSDNKSNYVFPFLDNNRHQTVSTIKNRIDKCKRKVNKDLKEIALLSQIDVNLTTYVARHTTATELKRTGSSTSLISEVLGHSTEKVTQTYLDSFENTQISDAMNNL